MITTPHYIYTSNQPRWVQVVFTCYIFLIEMKCLCHVIHMWCTISLQPNYYYIFSFLVHSSITRAWFHAFFTCFQDTLLLAVYPSPMQISYSNLIMKYIIILISCYYYQLQIFSPHNTPFLIFLIVPSLFLYLLPFCVDVCKLLFHYKFKAYPKATGNCIIMLASWLIFCFYLCINLLYNICMMMSCF